MFQKYEGMPVKEEKKTGNKSVLLTFLQYDMQFTEIRQNFMIPGGIPIWMPYHDARYFFFKQIENIVFPK